MNANNKQEQEEKLAAMRLELKILSLQRVIEAIKADEWSDVAKLGKESYSMMVKEEATLGAKDALRFQMIASLQDPAVLRKYVESEESQTFKRGLPSAGG